MKRITRPLLLTLAAGAVTACGTTETLTGSTSTALSISGNLKTTTALTLNSSRIDQYDAYLASLPQYTMAVTYSDFLVSCVTFAIPPVAGTGGSVGTDGKFTVAFPEGTVGASFGCFISKPADTAFDPIPMVFKDTTKASMSGDAKKDTRLAVTGSIVIPEVSLDLENGTAEVDTATITKADTGTSTDVVKTVTGEKFDFSGSWVIESLAANNITAPAGYKQPCTFDEMFADEWNRIQTQNWDGPKACDGPVTTMKLYMLRLAGKNFVRDATCVSAVDANHSTGAAIATCGGTAGTEDRYGIKLWGPEGGGGNLPGCTQGGDEALCKASFRTMVDGMDPKLAYKACGRRMGFSMTEAKAFAEIDFTNDPNYSNTAPDPASITDADTKYYEGAYPFANTVTLTDSSLFAACSGGWCPPFKQAANNITDGWKLSQAQTQWAQQNNCKPVDVLVGGKPAKAWRCYGTYDPTCNATPPAACAAPSGDEQPAFNEGAGGGCVDEAGVAVQFDNWDGFWGPDKVTCTNVGSVVWLENGVASAEKYTIQSCTENADLFNPTQNNAPVAHTGKITCKSGGGMFYADGSPIQNDPNSWQNFRTAQAAVGVLCELMPTDATDPGERSRQQLAQLQCYAQAYERAQDSMTGCTRQVRFNWGTQNPWEFVANNDGPAKARGEFIFELFNYTDANSGAFSTIEADYRGVRVKDSNGNDTWVPCRVNRAETITVTAISATKMLAEMTSVNTLANKENASCVAAAENGQLEVGTSKMMFVMSKQ